MTERRILGKHGGEYYGSKIGALGVVFKNLVFSREYTMVDRINCFRGIFQSVKALYPELCLTDLFVELPEVKIPVYFCLGRHDYEVPSVLSAKYFEALKAVRRQKRIPRQLGYRGPLSRSRVADVTCDGCACSYVGADLAWDGCSVGADPSRQAARRSYRW